MKRTRIVGICLLMAMVAFLSVPALAATETITGLVNEYDEITTDDGVVYVVADTVEGQQLMANSGKRVTVTGAVSDDGGVKTITVTTFTVVND